MSAFTLLSVAEVGLFTKLQGWFSFGFSAIAVLAMLIVVHEFGHFITGRLLGARVEKFSIGFGKTIFSRVHGDTEYILAWIPLGGFVKFYGDDPDVKVENEQDSFFSLSVWKRLLIVAAGPVFNIALAIFIAAMAAMVGLPEGTMVVDKVQDDTPAMAAGIAPGDKIEAINGVTMAAWGDVVDVIRKSPGKEIEIEVTRESGQRVSLGVTPKELEVDTIDGKKLIIGQIGVMPRQKIVSYSPGEAIVKGFEWTWTIFKLTLWGISKLVSREIPAGQIAGPIGIMQLAGNAADSGFVNLLLFIGLISVNIGILNLLPIPVLDGGHIVFFSLEAVLGRPVKIKTQEVAQQVGVFLLISLMALAFYNDIVRLITG